MSRRCHCPLLLVAVFLISGMTPVHAQFSSADSLWQAELREEALIALDQELERVVAEADTLTWIEGLVQRGTYLKNMDDPVGAEVPLRLALDLAEAGGDSSLACAPRRWLGVALTAQGRNDEALVEYRRLASLSHAVGDGLHEAWAHVGLGWDADLRRDHTAARDFYASAAALFETEGDGEGALWANLGEANALFHLGRYEAASDGWDRVARIAAVEGFARHEAITRNNIAGLQMALGRPDIALRQYGRAVAVWDSLGQSWERTPPALNRATCLGLVGRVDEARSTLNDELETCRSSHFADYEIRALRKLAELERDHGDSDRALELYEEALALGVERPAQERADVLMGMAAMHSRTGDHTRALASLNRALRILDNDRTSQIRLRVELASARTLLQLGLKDEASRHLDFADQIMGTVRARLGLDLEQIRASLHEINGEPQLAREALERAADLWEQERALPLDPEWREERGAAGRAIFSRLGRAILEQEGAEAAFDRLQPIKARTLRERLRGPGAAALSDSGMAAIPTALMLKESVLAEGELLLDAHSGAAGGLLFALTRDTCLAVVLPPEQELAADLLAWRDLLADPRSLDQEREDLEANLRVNLFTGWSELLAASTKVIVAPDGALNLAPLSLLAPGGDARWTRIPSAAILQDLRVSRSGSTMAGAVTVLTAATRRTELAGADWQAQRLAATIKNVSILRCPTPDPVPDEETLRGAGVIHVAAHVQSDDLNAWHSAVVLGDLPQERLSAAAVAGMSLDARLVVLASCESARGRIVSGEGVQGLASAFLAAGAPAVIASLWPVDDDLTALLMDHFYGHLAEGVTVAEALEAAANDLRIEPATAHPFVWAGFVVIGDGEATAPLELKRAGLPFALWLPLLGVGILGVVILRRRF